MQEIIKRAVTAICGLAVTSKLTGKTKKTFGKAGYSSAFMYAKALVEAILAAALFIPYDLHAAIGLMIPSHWRIQYVSSHASPWHYRLTSISFPDSISHY